MQEVRSLFLSFSVCVCGSPTSQSNGLVGGDYTKYTRKKKKARSVHVLQPSVQFRHSQQQLDGRLSNTKDNGNPVLHDLVRAHKDLSNEVR